MAVHGKMINDGNNDIADHLLMSCAMVILVLLGIVEVTSAISALTGVGGTLPSDGVFVLTDNAYTTVSAVRLIMGVFLIIAGACLYKNGRKNMLFPICVSILFTVLSFLWFVGFQLTIEGLSHVVVGSVVIWILTKRVTATISNS
jgi:hypothetical protein